MTVGLVNVYLSAHARRSFPSTPSLPLFQEARRTAFINASAAVKPLLELASNFGPEYTAFLGSLVDGAIIAMSGERTRRLQVASAASAAAAAAGRGAPGRASGAVSPGPPADEAAAAAGTAEGPPVLNPRDVGGGGPRKRHKSGGEQRKEAAARKEARAATSGPLSEAIAAAAPATTVKGLQAALRAAGLPTDGLKNTLLQRLAEYQLKQSATAPPPPPGPTAPGPGPSAAGGGILGGVFSRLLGSRAIS